MKSSRYVSQQERTDLIRYLSEVDTVRTADADHLRKIGRRVIPAALRPTVRRLATDAMVFRERRRAAAAYSRGSLKLHLGSGKSVKAGWVSMDLFGDPVDIAWNLSRPLPFARGSVDAIFHEHVLEHFGLQEGFKLLIQCFNVLKPRGILRIGVPDAEEYIKSYFDNNNNLLDVSRPGRPTRLLALQEVFYHHGHRTMYDFDTLALLCGAAGFSDVQKCRFGESRLTPAPDSRHRKLGTVYVESVK